MDQVSVGVVGVCSPALAGESVVASPYAAGSSFPGASTDSPRNGPMSDTPDLLPSDPIDALLRPPDRRPSKPLLIGACIVAVVVAVVVVRSGQRTSAASTITAEDLPFAGSSPTSAAGAITPSASTSGPPASASPSGASAGAVGPSAPTGSSGPAAEVSITQVVVHIAGAVRSPGVYRLRPDARLEDAVAAAGGLSSSADTNRVNLAERVADGSRWYVPKRGETSIPQVEEPSGQTATAGGPGGTNAASGPGSGVAGEGTTGPINLNTADQATLETLPGVGPATAAAIINFREREGPLTSVDQLLDVPGIGTSKLEQIAPNATV